MARPNEHIQKPNLTSRVRRILNKRLHILQWFPHYTKNDILADFIAGLTVGLTMMPQSIAYAGLAGISPQYGLYTAFIGSYTYVFFGTIKEVSIGPTSLMSLLTFSFVKGNIECVILLTFIAGCMELLMGILNLGFLVDFISPCLTSGFTSASALIIIVAQLKHLLGIRIQSHDTFNVMMELSQHLSEIKWQDTLLGCSCIMFLICFKKLTSIPTKSPSVKKMLWFLSISKNALIVLLTSFIGAYLEIKGGGAPFKLTGEVPKGMPDVGFPSLSTTFENKTLSLGEMVKSLGSGVIVIPVIAVLANVAIAKSYSADVVVDVSQEMMTLGLCNIFGSFVKAMPSCGAFTRSSVASSSDVRTPLQGIYSGTLIILALSFLAPYFSYIPKATLAAVLITAGSSLVDYQIFPILWKCNKIDFFLTLATFIIGVVKGVEMAIVIGCVFNAMVLLKMWSRPNVISEVRTVKENNQNYIYIKPQLGLFYPAADYLSEIIKKAHSDFPKMSIAVDCAGILKVDYSAAKTLENLLNTYNEKEISLCLINVSPEVLKILKTITDTTYLQLCKSTDSFKDEIGLAKYEHEEPLLAERRMSSVKSERKLSLYDLE